MLFFSVDGYREVVLKYFFFRELIYSYAFLLSELVKNGRSILSLDARTYGKPSQKEGQLSKFGQLRASLLKLVKNGVYSEIL